MKKALFLSMFSLIFSLALFAQSTVPDNWFNLDPGADGINGVSTERVYAELLKGKKSTTVVVAVIDSGVDYDHEDLQDVMWVNEDEIPGNNKDDDNNGYVDDIHGWNFIGGKDGQNVKQDNLEITRLYRKYHKNWQHVTNPVELKGDERVEYAKYMKYKKAYEKNRDKAKKQMDKMDEQKMKYHKMLLGFEKKMGNKPLTVENVEGVDVGDDSDLNTAKRVVMKVIEEDGVTSFGQIFEMLDEQFEGATDYYASQYNYWYNIDFDPRNIVGDDYSDPNEIGYGNNDVEGPEASHGTHVSGIIAAVRDNGKGMKGVADNVRIMSLRAVPDGDERDKDVANAIRYAVDNGASVINMSFGKGFSWDKGVVDEAVKYAAKNDVLLVHAAGNSAQDNDVTDNFPNATFEKSSLFAPKECKTWIEVGALSWKDGESMPASFTNYGAENVDLFAPGVALNSTIPGSEYASMSGTSMASPVVAGVAAVVRSYFPNLTAKQVKKILMKSVIERDDAVNKPGTDEMVSFSELSATGGIVNVYNAIELASKSKGKKSTAVTRASSGMKSGSTNQQKDAPKPGA